MIHPILRTLVPPLLPLAMASATLAADALGDPPDLEAVMRNYDTNRDGALSRAEAVGLGDEPFRSIVMYFLDGNGDGEASAAEVRAAIAEQRAHRARSRSR